MTRYRTMFANLDRKQQGAFVPYVTLGDPTPEASLDIIETLINAGADGLELGFPYSDPIADGPIIQASSIRALDAGVRPKECFDIIHKIRNRYPDIPIGILLYSNLVLAKGLDPFYDQAASSGVDSVLIADVPVKESQPFCEAAIKHSIAPIFIVPPNITEANLQRISKQSEGYTYLLSRAGVTGTESVAQMPAAELIKKLSHYKTAPPLLGFGISRPEHISSAINAGAKGVISGSAVVKKIEENIESLDDIKAALNDFTSIMKAATYYQRQTRIKVHAEEVI